MKNTNMTSTLQFNPDKLQFIKYTTQEHRLPILNFAQSNGEDPLQVQSYYHGLRNKKLPENELIFVLRYEKEWVGFFSIGLTTIKRMANQSNPKIQETDTNNPIEGLLINKIGIVQNYRCFGIGKYILQFCIGLVKSTCNESQIRIIIFETTRSLAEKIYYPKYKFNFLEKENKLVWAYKKVR
jgi:hypothetical protein